MSFLQEIKPGLFYIMQKVTVSGQRRNKIIRKATEAEVKAYRAAKNQKKDLTFVTCSNPECDKTIAMTRSQRRKFFRDSFVRYKRFDLPYCSKECQQAHLIALRKLN